MRQVPLPVPLQQLLAKLRAQGVADERVLQALASTPREVFLPEGLRVRAWEDFAFDIGFGQTISQPSVVARMIALAQVGPEDRVLEIGTGSGFQTAVLARLCRFVFTVERIPQLAAQARSRLAQLGLRNVTVQVMDGSLGWRAHAPYDVILVSAAAPTIPPPLLEQLAQGGRLVAPVGGLNQQELVRVTRGGEGFFSQSFGQASFVPLVGKEGFAASQGGRAGGSFGEQPREAKGS
ncbi:MAG: protein-L-isoaspartate(D-aspartate) O-methyltransferase [Thermoanaerobaculum sp.]|nr:protein-L-isoaspartate(D-aspartate) O-methyltransferase [Thermoanaerobaculum sp.]